VEYRGAELDTHIYRLITRVDIDLFPLRFPHLETLKLISHLDRFDERSMGTLRRHISLFNLPSGQHLQRVELHGQKQLLQQLELIIREALPAEVKLEVVELEVPEERHHSWNLAFNWLDGSWLIRHVQICS